VIDLKVFNKYLDLKLRMSVEIFVVKMKKQLGLKLRDTEVIIECEGVTSWINKKARECQLAIVGSKYQNFELA
jgi:hypothetical protein